MKERYHILCSIFDYTELTEWLERNNNLPIGEGAWQEKFTILPNVKKVKEITHNVTPLYSGTYWLVFDNTEIQKEMVDELENTDFWVLDYITRETFINN